MTWRSSFSLLSALVLCLVLHSVKAQETVHALDVPYSLAEEFLLAAKLASLAYNPDLLDEKVAAGNATELGLDYVKAFREFPDASFVASNKATKTCFGVFRGTDGGLFIDDDSGRKFSADWIQNIHPGHEKIKGCGVRKGYSSALFNNYFDDFHDALAACLENDCPDCSLTLVGHSQGGAAAVIAAIVYEAYHPKVITFGAPKAVLPGCDKLVHESHFRLVNMIRQKRGTGYDLVSMLPGMGATHIGNSILLEEGSGAYMGLDEGNTRWSFDVGAHLADLYVHNIEHLIAQMEEQMEINGIDTLSLHQYSEGIQCGYDDECLSHRCDQETWTDFGVYVCKGKLSTGQFCNEDSDCDSDNCRWWMCK